MKAKRFLATILSGGLAVLTLFSFVGCGENGAEELKKQIAALDGKVQTLETALKTEQDKNAENQAKIDELEGSLKTEQDSNKENQAKLDELATSLKTEQDKNAENQAKIEELEKLKEEYVQLELKLIELQETTVDRAEYMKLDSELQILKQKFNAIEEHIYLLESDHSQTLSLKWAYRKGLITKEDLKSIAYYHHGESNQYNEELLGENFIPQEKIPQTLNETTKIKINQAQLADSLRHNPEAKIEDKKIINYYVCYNGSYVVKAGGASSSIEPTWIVEEIETIAGVNFHYFNRLGIIVWKEN